MKDEVMAICAAQMYQIRNRLAAMDFGDIDKNALRDSLCAMADVIHGSNLKGLNTQQQLDKKCEIEQFTEWMFYLMSSRNLMIPLEMEFVVRELLRFWLGHSLDQLVLVFVEGSFAVTRFNKIPIGISSLEARYGIRFAKDPVFISIPRYCKQDFLFNIALFHEIGHVVDQQLNLYHDVKEAVKQQTGYDSSKKLIRDFFPILHKAGRVDEKILISYIKEYIADLFSAQYLGEYLLTYLDYLEPHQKKPGSVTHPSYIHRKKMINDLLACMRSPNHMTSNFLLQYIMDSFSSAGKGDLILRWTAIHGRELMMGQSVSLNSLDELFSVFKHSWDVVFNGINNIEAARGLAANSLSCFDFYYSINTGIQNGISALRARIAP